VGVCGCWEGCHSAQSFTSPTRQNNKIQHALPSAASLAQQKPPRLADTSGQPEGSGVHAGTTSPARTAERDPSALIYPARSPRAAGWGSVRRRLTKYSMHYLVLLASRNKNPLASQTQSTASSQNPNQQPEDLLFWRVGLVKDCALCIGCGRGRFGGLRGGG
jgi:hypothetical protein